MESRPVSTSLLWFVEKEENHELRLHTLHHTTTSRWTRDTCGGSFGGLSDDLEAGGAHLVRRDHPLALAARIVAGGAVDGLSVRRGRGGPSTVEVERLRRELMSRQNIAQLEKEGKLEDLSKLRAEMMMYLIFFY